MTTAWPRRVDVAARGHRDTDRAGAVFNLGRAAMVLLDQREVGELTTRWRVVVAAR